ncbi:MAG: AI-2E family transporter [Xanthomonadaceae bacterium]|nr:AI-2E family transporter [Xanthomonadaceae bacterium]MDP2186314.1 AI-2E family transporter [Xanthomonadales bacterium]MDZ4115735.1 AI-2E family transporter [Xanthomonadaceae bacterium]MDZ4379361.1 AI-2E family transporter [Xanthomonadaceae bacterium]
MNPTAPVWQPLRWLLPTAVIGLLLYLLGPVLIPFAISALLAWLGDPLVGRCQRHGMSRSAAVSLVFVLMSVLLLLSLLIVIPLLERQTSQLITNLPRYLGWLKITALPWLEQRTGLEIAAYFDPDQLVALLKGHWQQAGGIASAVFAGLSRSGLAIAGWLATALLVPVVTFYFLRDWPKLVARIRELLPRQLEPTVVRLAQQSDEVLGAFLRGQVSVMIVLGAIYALGLSLVGIDLAFLIGMGSGLLSFVPYLGAFLGVAAGLVAALVQHGDWLHVLLVLGVFGIGQLLESFVLTPWLVGDRIGMHPVAVIFAIMAGGQLFGFLGVLLALPVAAVVMVVLRYAHQRYLQSDMYLAGATPETESSALATSEDTADMQPAIAPDEPV